MNTLKENLLISAVYIMYNSNHVRHMHRGLMDSLKLVTANQLNTFLRTVLDSQYGTWSLKVKVFPFAFNSQVRTNMNLSPYELVFCQKPKKPIMFNLSSTTNSVGNCKPIENSPCKSLPNHTHTDHLGHHPQIKKLQKGTFAQPCEETLGSL